MILVLMHRQWTVAGQEQSSKFCLCVNTVMYQRDHTRTGSSSSSYDGWSRLVWRRSEQHIYQFQCQLHCQINKIGARVYPLMEVGKGVLLKNNLTTVFLLLLLFLSLNPSSHTISFVPEYTIHSSIRWILPRIHFAQMITYLSSSFLSDVSSNVNLSAKPFSDHLFLKSQTPSA